MQEKTYKILSNYNLLIPYSFSIPVRNAITAACSSATTLLSSIVILLKSEDTFSVILAATLAYLLLGVVLLTTVFLHLFLAERRHFLVQNKL